MKNGYFCYLVTQTAPAGRHRTEWVFLASARGGTGWQMHTLKKKKKRRRHWDEHSRFPGVTTVKQIQREINEAILLRGREKKLLFLPLWLTGDAAGVPGHWVGDVVLFGGCNDDPCSCPVQEAHPQDAIAACLAGRQDGLIAVDFHLSARQRWQVAVVEHLDFYLHLCKSKNKIQLFLS